MMEEEEMKPGRELDAKVAEVVMGWEWCFYPPFKSNHLLPPDRQHGTKKAKKKYEYEIGRSNIPFYSKDIAAAWQVVEKITQSGKFTCEIYRDDAEFQVVFETVDDEPYPFVAHEDLAPHAICLAALEAASA